jgi:hypothetical protein
MSETHASTGAPDEPVRYEIRVKGHLADRWAGWFEGLTIARQENGDTLLAGPVVDQAALHGLLSKVRDLGMPLLSVMRLESGQADSVDDEQHKRCCTWRERRTRV